MRARIKCSLRKVPVVFCPELFKIVVYFRGGATTKGLLARTLHESALFGLASAWMHLQIPKRSVGDWSLQFVWALWVPHKL